MSGPTYAVRGIKPPDEKWTKMRAAWIACEAAGITPPKEVRDFFGDEPPDPAGVTIDLTWMPDRDARRHACLTKWEADMCEGWEVDLTKLPADVTRIRFEARW